MYRDRKGYASAPITARGFFLHSVTKCISSTDYQLSFLLRFLFPKISKISEQSSTCTVPDSSFQLLWKAALEGDQAIHNYVRCQMGLQPKGEMQNVRGLPVAQGPLCNPTQAFGEAAVLATILEMVCICAGKHIWCYCYEMPSYVLIGLTQRTAEMWCSRPGWIMHICADVSLLSMHANHLISSTTYD